VASDRAVLPPLEVEVVAGKHRRPVQAASSSVRVDMQSESVEPQDTAGIAWNSEPTTAPVVDAAETVHLSPSAAQVVSRSVEPSYPLLAKEMKVQGSVVLQALIGRNGNIEDLRVLSGPAILSSAAMQAVKQWRFRPYLLAGEPVETQARITVNFTISTN
jgi:TonB family protein